MPRPDPDELAAHYESFIEDAARRAADILEERWERNRRQVERVTMENPITLEQIRAQGLGHLISGTELATSPWECPSRSSAGHPDRCGIFTNPPVCRVGGCTKFDQEALDG